MQFLIDGYNLLFFHLTPNEDLKRNREELITLLDTKLKVLGIQATVVFDGFTQMKNQTNHQYFEALTIIFSTKDQTADKNLSQQCRNLGSHCKTPKSFLKDIAKKQSENESLSQNEKQEYEDSKTNIERLLALFEKKLKESEMDQQNIHYNIKKSL